MKTQAFSLNYKQLHEIDIILFAFKDVFVYNDLTSNQIDFENNMLFINDKSLFNLINILSWHTDINIKTSFTELYNSILDEFTKQDCNNIIQAIIPFGIQQTIL